MSQAASIEHLVQLQRLQAAAQSAMLMRNTDSPGLQPSFNLMGSDKLSVPLPPAGPSLSSPHDFLAPTLRPESAAHPSSGSDPASQPGPGRSGTAAGSAGRSAAPAAAANIQSELDDIDDLLNDLPEDLFDELDVPSLEDLITDFKTAEIELLATPAWGRARGNGGHGRTLSAPPGRQESAPCLPTTSQHTQQTQQQSLQQHLSLQTARRPTASSGEVARRKRKSFAGEEGWGGSPTPTAPLPVAIHAPGAGQQLRPSPFSSSAAAPAPTATMSGCAAGVLPPPCFMSAAQQAEQGGSAAPAAAAVVLINAPTPPSLDYPSTVGEDEADDQMLLDTMEECPMTALKRQNARAAEGGGGKKGPRRTLSCAAAIVAASAANPGDQQYLKWLFEGPK